MGDVLIPDHHPRVHPSAWLAPGATVIGDVRLAAESSVWFSSVVRADLARIAVGEASNIQDGCVVHADPDFPVTVGERVSVGHRAVLHGCTVGDDTLVGMGAIVLNGACIGSGAIVAAGSLVAPGVRIPDGCLAMGSPAKVVRETTPAEREATAANARHYVELMRGHRAGPEAGG